MNILLGMTGSVATTLAPRIIGAMEGIQDATEVRVVMTDKACMFQNAEALSRKCGVAVHTERCEWTWIKELKITDHLGTYLDTTDKWEKGLPILHVELAKWASAIVIAPATMNTIAKIANGLADNLLTSIVAASLPHTPIIIAPSMNTQMWYSAQNQRNIETLLSMRGTRFLIAPPATKELACGDRGMGALADTATIAGLAQGALQWGFPFPAMANCPGIPIGSHPGAFGATRKHDRHCGIDLYCPEGSWAIAVEPGTVAAIEDFTGSKAGCPWWLDTMAVKVEGPSGTVCYGEIIPARTLKPGDRVRTGDVVGTVTPVLRPGKERPDIPGHSRSMLHLQLYTRGSTHRDHDWGRDTEMPGNILDPTGPLMHSRGCPEGTLDMPAGNDTTCGHGGHQ